MLNLSAINSRLPYICSWRGQNESLPRTATLYAAATIATIALSILGAITHHTPAHADGGASTRSQTSAPAPDQTAASIQASALRILRALSDRDANNWARYWQARADCDALPTATLAAHAPPRSRVLLALTTSICAQLDALLDVNPAAYQPRAEDRSVGLLLSEPGAALGYTLLTGYWNHDAFLLDPLGRVAHSWHMPAPFNHAKLLDNGNLLVGILPGIVEFDPRGNKIWEYKIDGLHHDFLKMPNGNVLLIVYERKSRAQAIAAGANPQFVHQDGINYDYLLELRPAGASGGEIVWQWSPWDHLVQDFDPTKENYGAIAEHPELIDINFLLEAISESPMHWPKDWMHTNSLDYNPELDQIMLSPRHFSELWIIDHSATTQEARGHAGGNGGIGGDLLYRWGNPRAYDHGDAAGQRLFRQHQTHWIPPGLPGAGNILLFNNGWEFAGYERFYSSIDELALPADGYRYRRAPNSPYPPNALAWTYVAEPPADFYAPILSGAQRLPNGNTLIVDGPAGTILQVTPDGRIVWKYVAPLNRRAHLRQGERPSATWQTFPTPYGDPVPVLNNRVYRAYWYPPDHPGLQALDLTPGAYIEDLPDIYDRATAIVAAISAGDFGAPIARSDFDIYLDAESEDTRRLIYIKRPCAAEDAQAWFFLHITPAAARDLPTHRQEHGFVNLDFNFDPSEVQASDDWCLATRRLPAYPIQRIRTGQFVSGEGAIWRAEINLNE